MRIAIGLTLLIGAASMAALFRINLRQFRLTRHERSRQAMIVTGTLSGWCLIAAIWMFAQDF
jgi:hypothetical protein